jgi:hypothetical protein
VGIKDSHEYSNKIEITTHIPTLTNNSKEHNYDEPNIFFYKYLGIKYPLIISREHYSWE